MIPIIILILLNLDCCDAFIYWPCPSTYHHYTKINRERIKLYQLGNDYLNTISANNEEDDDSEEQDKKYIANRFLNVASNVSSDVGRRSSIITTSISSVAEKGTSDIQSLAKGAIYGVEKVTKRGTRDIKRTTIKAQQVVKKSTSSLSLPTVGSGKGLTDLHFFDIPSFGSSSNFSPIVNLTPPKIESEEIVKWIDSQAKSGTEIVSSKAKTLVLNFTGKTSYEFGDVAKEVVHRVSSYDINMQDMILLLKILLALGATLGPVAELMPFTFLIEALNISLEQKVGGKILEVLSKTLDNRLVAALFTSDDKSLIGDVVKRSVLAGVLKFTGKQSYESGDIQRTVQQGQEEGSTEDMQLDLEIAAEFEAWDRMFVDKIQSEEEQANEMKEMDIKIAQALETCEAIAQRKVQ